jgi:hypothetical protein
MIKKFAKGLVNGILGGLSSSTNNPAEAKRILSSGSTIAGPGETHYWKFMPPKKGNSSGSEGIAAVRAFSGFGPAPRIAPNGNVDDNPDINSPISDRPATHINVRDSHHWTESPRSARGEVPMLTLKEYKILTNPMLNQMANNIMTAVQASAEVVGEAGEALNKALGALDEIKSSPEEDPESTGNKTESMLNRAKAAASKIGSAIGDSIEQEETKMFADPMEPYKMLYTLKSTDFRYTFPYMEDTYRSISSGFSEQSEDMLGTIPGLVNEAAKGLTNIANSATMRTLRKPGVMIEKPQAFSFSGREKSYTVNFPLFNTKNYAEIIKNWQFLFLLVYQNTPNRITKDLIDPPCIYEARIPGMWYSKYAAISNMTVNFVGARREMPVPVMFLEQKGNTWSPTKRKVTTIIPDAYQVSITVRELFGETQNFMYQMLREVSDSVITVNGV